VRQGARGEVLLAQARAAVEKREFRAAEQVELMT
jgi:hypothetical protein